MRTTEAGPENGKPLTSLLVFIKYHMARPYCLQGENCV